MAFLPAVTNTQPKIFKIETETEIEVGFVVEGERDRSAGELILNTYNSVDTCTNLIAKQYVSTTTIVELEAAAEVEAAPAE